MSALLIPPPLGLSHTSTNVYSEIERSPRSLQQEERNVYEQMIHKLNFLLTQQNQKTVKYKKKTKELEERLRYTELCLEVAKKDIAILAAEHKEMKCKIAIEEAKKKGDTTEEQKLVVIVKSLKAIQDNSDSSSEEEGK